MIPTTKTMQHAIVHQIYVRRQGKSTHKAYLLFTELFTRRHQSIPHSRDELKNFKVSCTETEKQTNKSQNTHKNFNIYKPQSK